MKTHKQKRHIAEPTTSFTSKASNALNTLIHYILYVFAMSALGEEENVTSQQHLIPQIYHTRRLIPTNKNCLEICLYLVTVKYRGSVRADRDANGAATQRLQRSFGHFAHAYALERFRTLQLHGRRRVWWLRSGGWSGARCIRCRRRRRSMQTEVGLDAQKESMHVAEF